MSRNLYTIRNSICDPYLRSSFCTLTSVWDRIPSDGPLLLGCILKVTHVLILVGIKVPCTLTSIKKTLDWKLGVKTGR